MSLAAKQQIKDFIMAEFLPGESPDELTDTTPLISGGILDSIATRLRVVTPAHATGAVEVVVTNPDGQSVTVAAAYTFLPPTRVTPPPGPPRTVTRP